jgi:hypothetical protein
VTPTTTSAATGGWSAAADLDEWIEALGLARAAAPRASQWVHGAAVSAAVELLRREPEGGRAPRRSSLVR